MARSPAGGIAKAKTAGVYKGWPALLGITEGRVPRSSVGDDPVLVGFALVGAACSLVVGWLNELNVALLLALVGIYGIAIIGDSSVLSSAMTDAVPASQLGRALGLWALGRVPCRPLRSAWHS